MATTTFTRTALTIDPATEVATETVTTVAGNAIQVRGNPQRYKELGLVLSTAPTLFFAPSDYNLAAFSTDFVQPGDTVVWQSKTYVVKEVDPIAPDGVIIAAARIIVAS